MENAKQIVRLTATAAAKVRGFRQADAPYLRVSVLGGGDASFTYSLQMDGKIDVHDFVDRSERDIVILADRRSAIFLEGTTIDWRQAADGRQGFDFDNPNAVKTKPGTNPAP